jgi:hypothetical protein
MLVHLSKFPSLLVFQCPSNHLGASGPTGSIFDQPRPTVETDSQEVSEGHMCPQRPQGSERQQVYF